MVRQTPIVLLDIFQMFLSFIIHDAYEYLKLCEITGLSKKTIKDRSIELRLAGLDHNNKRIGTLAGMKQRLGIAQALLHEPKLHM